MVPLSIIKEREGWVCGSAILSRCLGVLLLSLLAGLRKVSLGRTRTHLPGVWPRNNSARDKEPVHPLPHLETYKEVGQMPTLSSESTHQKLQKCRDGEEVPGALRELPF